MDQTFSLHPLSQATSPFNAYNPNGVWHMDGEPAQPAQAVTVQPAREPGPSIYAGRPEPSAAAFLLPVVALVAFGAFVVAKAVKNA